MKSLLGPEYVFLLLALLLPMLAGSRATAAELPQGMTLAHAIEVGLSSHGMTAIRQSVEQANADIKGASALPNPSVNIEAGMLPLNRRFTEAKPGGPTDVVAGISLPVDWLVFGKRWGMLEAAKNGAQVAKSQYSDAERLIVLEIKTAFFTVLEAKSLLDVASKAVKDLEQTEDAFRKAVLEGARPLNELKRLTLEVQAARREERARQTELTQARASLAALIGFDGPLSTLVLNGSLEGPYETKPIPLDEAYKLALQNRPDIIALRQKVVLARSELKAERMNSLPEATLMLNVTRQFQETIGAPDATGWGIGLEMSVPIFDRNQAGRAKAKSSVVQAENEYQHNLAQLHGEVESATQTLQMAWENVQDIDCNELVEATGMRNRVLTGYEAGGLSYLDVLDAQASFREACRAYTLLKAEYFKVLATYDAVIGRRAP